jgi:hypothetical protein
MQMKKFAPLAALALILVSASICAQDAKPKTYTLVLEGAV